MAKTKKVISNHSGKWQRLKAHKSEKVRKHAEVPEVKHIKEAEIAGPDTPRVVSRIKKVPAEHHEYEKEIKNPSGKRIEKFESKVTHREEKACHSRKGYLNALCFWAGSLLSDGSAFFSSEKAE